MKSKGTKEEQFWGCELWGCCSCHFVVLNPPMPTIIFFPNASAGTEWFGFEACNGGSPSGVDCVEVPLVSLDDFAAKHLSAHSVVNHLAIDAEGADYLVLHGATLPTYG